MRVSPVTGSGPAATSCTRVFRSRTYTYLSSTWATPELTLDNGAPQDCWIWKNDSPGWDSDTYWPESALKILNAAVGDVVPPEIESA